MAEQISIDEFKRIEMSIGKIISVEKVPDTDKLLRLMVDLGEESPRQIVSGIALFFEDPQVLVGKHCPFVTNLEPRMLRGLESQGMIVAVSTQEGAFSILEPTLATIPPGTRLS